MIDFVETYYATTIDRDNRIQVSDFDRSKQRLFARHKQLPFKTTTSVLLCCGRSQLSDLQIAPTLFMLFRFSRESIETLSLNTLSDIQFAYEKLIEERDSGGTSDPDPDSDKRIRPITMSDKWIPIAQDIDAQFIVDLDPSEIGTEGQLFYLPGSGGPRCFVADSWCKYLEWFASTIENGEIVWDEDIVNFVHA